MKKMAFILLLMAGIPAAAQSADSLETADTTEVIQQDTLLLVKKKNLAINDYTTIGVSYGVTFSRMIFNPDYDQSWLVTPNYFSIMWTRYGKMFGYLPYFGIEAGLTYGHQGFQMPFNKEENLYDIYPFGTYENKYYVYSERMDILKIPIRAKFHVDFPMFRILADLGFYGGYRRSITRNGYNLPEEFANNFTDTEYRFDYGLEGGAGFALIFDPVEIQFNVLASWAWNSLFTPDSSPSKNNKYYYRFANPLDLIAMVGIHFQLTKRTGKTSRELKKAAYEQVYSPKQSPDSQ